MEYGINVPVLCVLTTRPEHSCFKFIDFPCICNYFETRILLNKNVLLIILCYLNIKDKKRYGKCIYGFGAEETVGIF